MNARSYKVKVILSALDFPPIIGMAETCINVRTEPPKITNNRVVLTITKTFVLDMGANEQHDIFSVQSFYEIPITEIKTREDIHEFYKDATLSLQEEYNNIQKRIPQLPSRSFPNQPIENYQREIDGVFAVLYREN